MVRRIVRVDRYRKGTTMRGKLLRVLLWILALQAAGRIVGPVIAKKITRGDEGSDAFRVAAIFGDRKFHSRATRLRFGTVIASMGGIDLDLRDATLGSEGAELKLEATLGGIQVVVPEDWLVDVDTKTLAGGFEVKVTPPEDLPEDAPKLHIDAVTLMGGVLVTTTPHA